MGERVRDRAGRSVVPAPPRAIVLLGVAIAACLHVVAMLHKSCWDHDETISYLAATGNQARYERALADSSLMGAWAPAARWKSLFAIEHPFAFARIGGDLARHDVHPPLYFWLLHVWVMLFGVNLWSGPLLNLAITAATGFALFRFARAATASREVAAIVLFLWLVAPIYRVAGDARQYQLLAFWSVLLYGQTWRVAFGERVSGAPAAAVIAVVVACGLLTHYHFAMPLAACGVALAAARPRAPRLAAFATAAAAGALVFACLHPGFANAFRTVVPSERPLSLSDLPYRAAHLPIALAAFGVEPQTADWLLARPAAAIATAALVGLAALLLARRAAGRESSPAESEARATARGGEASPKRAAPWRRGVAILLCTQLALFAGLYLLQITPMHAMGARYLSPLWPLACFVPLLPRRRWERLSSFAVGALAIGLVASSAIGAVLGAPFDFPIRRWLDPPPAALVSDTAARGVFPRVFMMLPDACAVLVAPQESLADRASPARVDEAFAADGAYFSSLRHAGTEAGREAVVARLSGRCAPARSEEFEGLGTIVRWRCP